MINTMVQVFIHRGLIESVTTNDQNVKVLIVEEDRDLSDDELGRENEETDAIEAACEIEVQYHHIFREG